MLPICHRGVSINGGSPSTKYGSYLIISGEAASFRGTAFMDKTIRLYIFRLLIVTCPRPFAARQNCFETTFFCNLDDWIRLLGPLHSVASMPLDDGIPSKMHCYLMFPGGSEAGCQKLVEEHPGFRSTDRG